MYKSIIIIAIVFACMSCQQAGQSNGNTVSADSTKPTENLYDMNAAAIRKHMDLQMHLEAPPIYHYTDADVNVALPVIAEGLKQNRFKPLSAEDFKQKIISIFGDVFTAGHCNTKQHDQFLTLLVNEKSNEFDYTEDNIFIAKEAGFITDVPLLGDFVKFTDSTHYKIELRPILISRNKYLLNDSKADLAVLLSEDTLFLKNLVLKYGYTKDAKLNELVMNDYLRVDDNSIVKVGEIIFGKDCNGKLFIREELLTWIGEHTTVNDNRLIEAVSNYAFAMYFSGGNGIFDKNPFDLYTLDEKRKIVAYVSNIYAPLYHQLSPKNQAIWPAATVLEDLMAEDRGLKDYIINNKYFGFEALKKELE